MDETVPSAAGHGQSTDALYHALTGPYRETPADDPAARSVVIDRMEGWSIAALEARVIELHSALAHFRCDPGDRVVVQVEKSVEALALYLACVRAGAVYVPLNPRFTKVEVEYFVRDAEASLLIRDPECPAVNPATVDQVEFDRRGLGDLEGQNRTPPVTLRHGRDAAAILYTSGTTGRSKGAVLSHDALLANGRALHDAWGFTADDVLLHTLPLFHVHGLFVAVHTAMLAGAAITLLDRFDVDDVLEQLPHASVMMAVPTHHRRLLADPRFTAEACSNVRLFTSGSAPLPAPLHDEFTARTGHVILERYGMTEAGIITSNPLDGERIAGTVGHALAGVELRVTNDRGDVLEPGTIGELEIRSAGAFSGYWNQPAKSAEAHRPGGWFRTGDVAMIAGDGRVTLEGRSGDMIISGGENVYPKEIELALSAVAATGEVAVVGLPHDDLGEAVTAFVAGAAVDENSLRVALRQQLAGFKVPRSIIAIDQLPRNAMGKVQKSQLRSEWAEHYRGH